MNEETMRKIRARAEVRYIHYREYAAAMFNLSAISERPEDRQRMYSAITRVRLKYGDLEQAAHNLEWLSGGKASNDWTLPPDLELKWIENRG